MSIHNEENIIEDLNKLIELYNNSSDKEKEKIYSQMVFIYELNRKLVKKYKIRNYKPKKYLKYVLEEEKNKKNAYKELDELSNDIIYNLNSEIIKYRHQRTHALNTTKYTFEEYKNIISSFFKDTLPDDLALFNKDIDQGNLIIRKAKLFDKASIYYLEELKKYYITICYSSYFNAYNILSTIHEYGHASTFINNGSYKSKDYIFEEVISTLYELMFLDYYLSKYTSSDNYIEILMIYNSSCISTLNDFFTKQQRYTNHIVNMLEATYGQIIATTIYTKYHDNDILNIIKIIKDNYSTLGTFEILNSIDITKEDLIDNSKDISKLILKR